MSKVYIVYSLTLLSSFIVYWCFAAMSVVAAGIDWVPIVSFIASTIHFGISSWLFFVYPKPGKILAIVSALLLSIWPVIALVTLPTLGNWIETPFYLVPLLCSIFVIHYHLKSFNYELTMPNSIAKIISIALPAGLFLYISVYMIKLFA
jgi:hypothetical protein